MRYFNVSKTKEQQKINNFTIRFRYTKREGGERHAGKSSYRSCGHSSYRHCDKSSEE